MNKVIFLQSKLPDDLRALNQIAVRWNSYAEELQKQTNQDGIWFVTPRPLKVDATSILVSSIIRQFPSVEKNVSVIFRIFALRKQIKAEKSGVTLVCGDNQQSFLLALALKITLKSLVRIQIQFHGDTYSFRHNKGARGFFRVCLSRLGIAFANSIRIVSWFQADEIQNISRDAGEKFVLAPIPIDFSRVATSSKNVGYNLAFVGRLHSERGISDLINILKLLKSIRPSTTAVVVGEGPLNNEIRRELASWIEDSTISVLGFQSPDEIRDIYASTKVLISTAPNEGYGLTLREAALSNVHVIARESKGSLGAKASFPSRIETFTNIDEAVRLIQNQLDKPNLYVSTSDFAFQAKTDTQGLGRLIKSWVAD